MKARLFHAQLRMLLSEGGEFLPNHVGVNAYYRSNREIRWIGELAEELLNMLPPHVGILGQNERHEQFDFAVGHGVTGADLL